MLRSNSRLFPLVLCLLFAACNFGEKKAPAAPKLVTPSEQEAQQFADEFIEAVSKPNVQRAAVMVDWDILIGRALADVTVGSPKFRAGFMKGAKNTAQTSSYVQQLANSVEQGAKISLLRIRGDEGGRSALLRILHSNGGVGYNELLLTKDNSGIVRAADVYVYASGEYMSDTVRRMYKFAAASEPTFMERLQKKKPRLLKMASMYKEMSEKTLGGKHKEAVALYKRMPPELKKEKSVLVAYVTASSSLDEAQYQSAIDELRKAFPNETGMDLMLIDGFILKERYDDALAAVDRLDKDLNGDPYLDSMRANMFVLKGDLDAAQQAALRASVRERTLIDPQWVLVSVSLARKDFAETARLLTVIENEYQTPIGDLTQVPDYAEFVRSEAYLRWRWQR